MMRINLMRLFVTGLAISSINMYGFSQVRQQASPRQVSLLDAGWKFINEDSSSANFGNAASWQQVTIPHDWAISGPFDENNDMYEVQILEDGDQVKRKRTGFTGGLPHVGVGWYVRQLDVDKRQQGKRVFLEFDGVMSNARIYVNDKWVGEWPYGYSSFSFDITDFLYLDKKNTLKVRVQNFQHASRWYPGAGIYRNVRMVVTEPMHVKHWGTYITTPVVSADKAEVKLMLTTHNKGAGLKNVTAVTEIFAANKQAVAKVSTPLSGKQEEVVEQRLQLAKPVLWDVNNPHVYTAVTTLMSGNTVVDKYTTNFGVRTIEFTNDKGFFINGRRVQLNGVCLHHDLGALGAAHNTSALRFRIKMMQDMGANAIRSTHNPPDPSLLQLCDEMGLLLINEAFDEWKEGKVENGYHKLWDKWAEKDLVAMIHRDRNHPSLIMWSIGNEVREQQMKGGDEPAKFLTAICHREDPTRPVTAGFNHVKPTLDNGLAAAIDVVGWNYKPQQYRQVRQQFPHFKMYGSETVSTIDTRGVYTFPAVETFQFDKKPPYHLSAYALSRPPWGTTPDREFKHQDEDEFIAGEFVWTGFDYLGEPTPFYEEWPSRSSYFGIVDLAGIPKDRYYLYQSKWTTKPVLHLLPHWNWQAGMKVPVHVFTNYKKAELFLNGKSMGVREKTKDKLATAYRLIWDSIDYQPGELKVVALDDNNKPVMEAIRNTAGAPYALRLSPDRTVVDANGKEMIFVTVTVVDNDGNPCPTADNLVNFEAKGAGIVKAVDNGDQTSVESFVVPYRKAFNGKCMVVLQGGSSKGKLTLHATSAGLQGAKVQIEVE